LQARLTSEAELLLVRRFVNNTSLGPNHDRRSIESPSTPRFFSHEAHRMISPPHPRDASACVAWSLWLPRKLKIFAYLANINRPSTRANLFYKNCTPLMFALLAPPWKLADTCSSAASWLGRRDPGWMSQSLLDGSSFVIFRPLPPLLPPPGA
jgi:hypothetical protein